MRMLRHVVENELWWHRDTLPGHVTASAFVVDPGIERLLLHHHRKLDRWLQLGGHDEGEQDPALTVLREIHEESGLTELDFFGNPVIFDLDVHPIPACDGTPAHDHLDVRYLLVANPAQTLVRDARESRELAWFPLAEAAARLDEGGAPRVMRKIRTVAEERARI